jgi:hypothetical protein
LSFHLIGKDFNDYTQEIKELVSDYNLEEMLRLCLKQDIGAILTNYLQFLAQNQKGFQLLYSNMGFIKVVVVTDVGDVSSVITN